MEYMQLFAVLGGSLAIILQFIGLISHIRKNAAWQERINIKLSGMCESCSKTRNNSEILNSEKNSLIKLHAEVSSINIKLDMMSEEIKRLRDWKHDQLKNIEDWLSPLISKMK